MKNKILGAVILLLAVAAIYLMIVVLVTYWSVIWGLFWTLVFGLILALVSYFVMEYFRSEANSYSPPRFHAAWTVVAVIAVFLIIWNYGYNVTMLGWEMKPVEKEFIYHADNDPYDIVYGEMDYHGSLDPILAKRDAILKKRHAVMIGDWWTDTENHGQIRAYYQHDWLWFLRRD